MKNFFLDITQRPKQSPAMPFLIAEAGINHNGDLETAYKMIKVAKQVGADAVKFQTYNADELYTDRTLMYTYISQGREVTEPQLDMFKRYEFTREQWFLIKKKCDEEDILFLSTPQSYSDLELLLEIGIPAIKVGSDEFTNLPLVKKYAQTELPLIVSCGMADLGEVYQSLKAIGTFEGYPTILLVCTSQYPTPADDANIKRVQTLKNAFPSLTVGFSDHTQGFVAATLAAALGAVVFEKHFTLSNDMPGPDHWFSENPESLAAWVNAIRTAYVMLGDGMVRPSIAEQEVKFSARRSVVALSDVKKGELFTPANLGLRRPGSGLGPSAYEDVLGKKAMDDIASGSRLKLGDFV